MKKVILLVLVGVLFIACEKHEQRYFAESDETKTLEAGIAAYESGDWDKWRSHFADTAKIYVNSKDHVSIDDRVAELKEMSGAFSSYGFDKDDDYIEMVIDKEKESWVYYWANHNATLQNGKELSIPVHLAVRFHEGKIVAEHVYFDGTELNAEVAAMAAAAAAATAEETPEGDGVEN